MANVMITEDELKQQFIKIIKQFSTNTETGEIIVWVKLVEHHSKFDDSGILKQKIKNILILLNEAKSSKEEFELLMKRDIETDIWYII